MSVDSEFQVLVVGGGLAGLATAGFLARVGLDPVVVERDGSLDAPSGPVELWPDAVTMLSWLDVADEVRAAGATVRSWSLLAPDGAVERTLPTSAPASHVAVEYGRLRAALRATVPDGTVRTDREVRAVEDGDGGVAVAFEGGVTERFDVVVGADGARSTTRGALGASGGRRRTTTSLAFPLGLPAGGGEWPGEAGWDGETVLEQWTDDGAVLRVLPTGDGPWGWLTLPESGSPRCALRQRLVDHVAGAGWLPSHPPERFRLHEDLVVEAPARSGTRVALVGDAARAPHRLAGLGPALALESAAALAGVLADDGTSLTRRLAAYACRRRSRLDAVPTRGRVAPPLAAVASNPPDALATAAASRGARLAATAAGGSPEPAVEPPRPAE